MNHPQRPEWTWTSTEGLVILDLTIPTPDGMKHPAAQGSKRALGKGRMIEQSKNVKPWRAAVTAACDRAIAEAGRWGVPLDGIPYTCPVVIDVCFTHQRPARPKFTVPAVTPDVDKQQRAIFDALVLAGVLADDALVIDVHARKTYPAGTPGALAGALPRPGARIVVTPWSIA